MIPSFKWHTGSRFNPGQNIFYRVPVVKIKKAHALISDACYHFARRCIYCFPEQHQISLNNIDRLSFSG